MLRQFLVGGGVSVVNIAIHALVMTTVVWVAQSRGAQNRSHRPLFLIAVMIDRNGFDGCACTGSDCLVFGIFDSRCCASGCRSRIFCVRQLHNTGLWRRSPIGALATAWPDDCYERGVIIWLVDRSHF